MSRFFKVAINLVLMGIIFVLLLLCIGLTIMQTSWAKNQISDLAIEQFRKNGIEAHLDGLEGQLPFSWKVKLIQLKFATDEELQFEHVTLRLAFFPLLRGQLVIDYLRADYAEYLFFQPESPSNQLPPTSKTDVSSYFGLTPETARAAIGQKLKNFTPLMHLSFRHLIVHHVCTHNFTTGKELNFTLEAKWRWKKNSSEFSLLCQIDSLGKDRMEIDLNLEGSKDKQILFNVKGHLDSLESLPHADLLAFEGGALFELNLEGPWKTWQSLIWNTQNASTPIQGKLRSKLKNVKVPNLPQAMRTENAETESAWKDLLQRDWLISSQFSVNQEMECVIKKLQVHSDLIHLKGQGEIFSDLLQSKASFAYSLTDLSAFSSFVNTDLLGKASGKVYFRKGKVGLIFNSDDLKLNKYEINCFQSHLAAKLYNGIWDGKYTFKTSEGILESQARFAFLWEPGKLLHLSDLALYAPDTTVTGNLKIDLPHLLFSGSLYGNIQHLTQFSSLFSQNQCDASAGIEAILSYYGNQQDIRLHLVSKNIRWNNYLVDDLDLTAYIHDLMHRPQGQIQLTAEKIFTPKLYLNQILLRTHSEEQEWPFWVHILGPVQEPCDLDVRGSWKKENELFTVNLNHVGAEIANEQIVLETPFDIQYSPSLFQLEPSDWSIGEGTASFDASFSTMQASAHMQLEHIPLHIFSFFKPKFNLQGSISASGFLSGNEENLQGSLNLALEEADVLHYGKKKAWKAKGSIQTHFDQGMLQIHSALHAVNEQFLDFSASIPLTHQLYPFRMAIDDLSPMSAELVAEGRIQDIFDFVNMGTHHLTGFISTRLLLSQSYAHPSLLGEILWQNGTYENYYTGTHLEKIEAKAEAVKDQIHLLELGAQDEDDGHLQVQGQLQLKPEAHFPYVLNCELDKLHLLRFDLIDCTMTGPLYLTGSTQSALAEGNLIVSYATIHIPDHLPYEIPELPITYINRPTYLSNEQIAIRQAFPFHIDLELTAEKDVHVVGKGLASEWQGSVRLTGTNTTVAANGSLNLLSGEYLFSGKAFKLTEGEIVFNDKPSPSAYLKLSGDLSLSDVEVTAQLRGPLTSPQLTFQSNPHMPTSSILARILFNKDIADISHPEALQLASTLMSLSGGAGPDVLEAIRKSIGVDRLTIVSSSASSDQIAIQIGKYLTKGVLITLSQSATSSQIIVEVELTKGFIFQAETQEEQEGKFSLKWRKSY